MSLTTRTSAPERDALRARLRKLRADVPPASAAAAARRSAAKLAATPEFVGARRVAAYVAVKGELDPAPILAAAMEAGKEVFLPRLDAGGGLKFLAWNESTPMRRNRFGIPEPDGGDRPALAADRLDLVVVPLVGFDSAGVRLGSGAGYYDRTFAFKLRAPDGAPVLAGLAYALQECARLEAAGWDVPLDLVATERRIRRFPAARPPRAT